ALRLVGRRARAAGLRPGLVALHTRDLPPHRRARAAHPLRDGEPGAHAAVRRDPRRRRERGLARAARRRLGADRRPRHPGKPRSRPVPRALRGRQRRRPRRAPAGRRPAGPRVQPRPRRPPGDGGGHARTPRRARPRRDRGGARLSTGVVLMTYGAPDGAADLPRYLAAVRGGRPASDELVAEMARRYEVIGGSPLVARTESQAAALERALGPGHRVAAGMRFSEPSIARVAAAAVPDGGRWRWAYQSAGHTPEEWLRPDLGEIFPELARAGHRAVLVAPVQFLADHLEVLYDLDVAAAAQAQVAGLAYRRIAMPNADPVFIAALAAVARRTVPEIVRPGARVLPACRKARD